MTTQPTSAPVSPIMTMGCTNKTLSFRSVGHQTVCLQSPEHGVQQLAHFNASLGDVVGLDDILEKTAAHTDLSDVANYITSSVSAAGTTLYFDPTGTGRVGAAFAVLQGVNTTLAQLVANGGVGYVPDQVTVSTAYNTPLTLRAAGLETVNFQATVANGAVQEIVGFNASMGDKLEMQNILNPTVASPTLADVASYISARVVNGNTVLSVDHSGGGQAGQDFAQLDGVQVTVAQLLASQSVQFTPSPVYVNVTPTMSFVYRSEGHEMANIVRTALTHGAAQLSGFSLGGGDSINITGVLAASGITADMTNIGHYITAVADGNSTDLFVDRTGSGHGGTEFAVLHNISVSMTSLLSHNAIHF